jgi:hypothetical protein
MNEVKGLIWYILGMGSKLVNILFNTVMYYVACNRQKQSHLSVKLRDMARRAEKRFWTRLLCAFLRATDQFRPRAHYRFTYL